MTRRTAYLMLEATEALGLEDDATLRMGKKMVDHALRNGRDADVGGFYDAGYYFEEDADLTIIQDTKTWWRRRRAQHAFAHGNRFPDDPMRYHEKFLTLWEYVQECLVDREYGGWYEGGLDKEPERRTSSGSHIWQGTYHNARALMNGVQRLRLEEF